GDSGTILTSSNALNWENHSTSNSLYLRKILYGNSRFLAFAYTVSPAYDYSVVSTDGVAWSSSLMASNKPSGILAFANGTFVYPVANGSNLLSADGISWAPQLSILTNGLYMLGSGANMLVAFDIRNHTLTSSDGTNWTFRGTNTLLRPESLAYGNGFWV